MTKHTHSDYCDRLAVAFFVSFHCCEMNQSSWPDSRSEENDEGEVNLLISVQAKVKEYTKVSETQLNLDHHKQRHTLHIEG